MKDALVFFLQNLVDKPDAVTVSAEEPEPNYVILTASVDPADMGKVIGKGGKIIKALRTLIKVIAVKEQKRVQVELLEAAGR